MKKLLARSKSWLTMKLIELKKIVAVPIQYYLLLFLLAITLIIISLLIPDKSVIEMSWSEGSESTTPLLIYLSNGSNIHSLFANFGYGIWGSTFVAFLVDIGATRRQSIDDKKEFLNITHDLKEMITAFIQFRTSYEQTYNIDTGDIPFNKWVFAEHEPLGKRYGHDGHSFKDDLCSYFLLMLPRAKSLKQNAIYLGRNVNINERFIHDLDILIEALELYDHSYTDPHNYDHKMLYSYLMNRVLYVIPCLFPEYHRFIYENWNHSEMVNVLGLPRLDIVEMYPVE